jgi:hypothetical protein
MICGEMEALEFKWPIHLCHSLVWQVDFRMLTSTQGLILSMFTQFCINHLVQS